MTHDITNLGDVKPFSDSFWENKGLAIFSNIESYFRKDKIIRTPFL